MPSPADYQHLTHINDHDELKLYELLPDIVWIFDLDKHGWWWGNDAALRFWGLKHLDELVNKDLSGDTQGARDRMLQTFELALNKGLTIDPWTTYPDGKPKTLFMRHRACLVGPDKHRGIIAYINEEVNLGDTPENLLLVEAMRYTMVLVTSFTFRGDVVIENPSATAAYTHINVQSLPAGQHAFSARFKDPEEGNARLKEAIAMKGGRWTHIMKTSYGDRKHTLDIRISRHPLSGEFLILMTEYDVTELHDALESTKQAKNKLKQMAHYDALTGLPSLHFINSNAKTVFDNAKRNKEQVAVMFVDLDGFKGVNDTWGHDAGDQVLVEVGKRISSLLRESDHVARIGGDEFVVLVYALHKSSDAAKVAEKLLDTLQAPIALQDAQQSKISAQISASIGVAFYPEHGETLEALIKQADESMYQVKKRGKADYALRA